MSPSNLLRLGGLAAVLGMLFTIVSIVDIVDLVTPFFRDPASLAMSSLLPYTYGLC
jgi:uncharacterized membrane protein YccF (DUF307 family)